MLGIVKGTGYLMFRGNGLQPYDNGHAQLPALTGFAIALGVAASFTWGDVDAGLYLRIGGGMDAVIGLQAVHARRQRSMSPVSCGSGSFRSAPTRRSTVIVAENSAGDLDLSIHGEACGHVNFFFFSVSGCVEITISAPDPVVQIAPLVEKVSLQSRSPALAQGSAVDRGIDTSLGQAPESGSMPAAGDMPVVPIDAIPVISMIVPPTAAAGVTVGGLGTATDDRARRRRRRLRRTLRRQVPLRDHGHPRSSASGPTANSTRRAAAAARARLPHRSVWWTINPSTESNPAAQLALLTWQAAPATKAIEYTEKLVETITDRWGTVCTPAAPPAEVLWTFSWKPLGPSATGWDLEGVAWPDPPGTQRSAPPDTTLHVSEPWRTGDPQLDALRGVVPAVVVGSTVNATGTGARPRHLVP